MDLRSPLSKARGLGAAKEGAHHWLMQRVTAIALIPLLIWLIVSLVAAASEGGMMGVVELLFSPVNAVLMIIFMIFSIYHGTLGMQVIIEDYVRGKFAKYTLLLLLKFIGIVTVVSAVMAIAYINFPHAGSGFKQRYVQEVQEIGSSTGGFKCSAGLQHMLGCTRVN